jgi:hypothetical protein
MLQNLFVAQNKKGDPCGCRFHEGAISITLQWHGIELDYKHLISSSCWLKNLFFAQNKNISCNYGLQEGAIFITLQ